jgi:copper chaperone NosL
MLLTAWLEQVLSPRARLAVLGAGIFLVIALFFSLWEITMFAQMFPEGIRMWIYPHKLVGGKGGADLQGINILNHYIGMAEIRAQDFPEMKFIPFALGLFFLLGLRTAVFGRVHQLVDLLVLFTYFGLFSLGAFYYRMYTFGHQLSPEAAIKVAPFTPPVLGHQHIANFDVYSYPGPGTYLLCIYALLLGTTLIVEARRERRAVSIRQEAAA